MRSLLFACGSAETRLRVFGCFSVSMSLITLSFFCLGLANGIGGENWLCLVFMIWGFIFLMCDLGK